MSGARTLLRARPDRFGLLGLTVVAVAVFHEALLGPRVFFQRDIHTVWYPQVETFVRAVAERAWPLWNPYAAFGLPLLADPSYQVLYPPTWLNLVMPPALYYKLFVFFHCLGAAAGVYLLARRWGLSSLASFVGGSVFGASGPLLSAASLFHHYAGAAWMPWVLVALDRLLEAPVLRRAAALGAVASLQVLAGSGDLCLMTAMAAVGYVAALGFTGSRPATRRRDLALQGLVSGCFALLLSAAQWVPTLALARSTPRAALDPATNMYWSLHPASLADLLVPRLVEGLPVSGQVRAAIFESREPFLACLYLGAPAAVLAGLAMLAPPSRARLFAAAAFLFFLLAALGRHTPLFPFLLTLPGVGIFRYPVKYLIPGAMCFALLAGLGMQAWLTVWDASFRRRALSLAAASVAVGLAALALAEWVRLSPASLEALLEPLRLAASEDRLAPAVAKLRAAGALSVVAGLLVAARRRWGPSRALTAALAALVVGDLVAVGGKVNPLAPPELMTHRPPLLAKLPPERSDTRIYSFPYPISWLNRQLARGPARWEGEWRWALGSVERIQPPSGARWRLYGSFDGDFTGLGLPAISPLSLWVESAQGTPFALRLLQMGGVDFMVALHRPPTPGVAPVAEWPSVYAAPIRLLEVEGPLPRAYAVDGARIADEPSSFALLADPGFDPRREVILPSGSASQADARFAGQARVAWRRTNAVRVEAKLSAPGYVVLLEAHDPGWRATVDGRAAPVLRANLLFRAVRVPPGEHVLELRYRPPAALAGAVLSGLGLLAALVTALAGPARGIRVN